ncbi:MAG: TolC family protein [Verrucomicrobia bacterium]|nr:TolC family protein [Verrucomicrobiota bacterium]
MNVTKIFVPLVLRVALVLVMSGAAVHGQDKPRPFAKLFGRRAPEVAQEKKGVAAVPAENALSAGGVSGFPAPEVRDFRKTREEAEVESTISRIYSEYEGKVANMSGADLQLDSLGALPPVRPDFEAAWSAGVRQPFWSEGGKVRQDLVQVYGNALTHSNAIKVFSDLPLIRETSIQEAEGDFDWRAFGEVERGHVDEPTPSRLTTGFTGRLLEDLGQADYGLRKKLGSGAEVSLSNRLNLLDTNSSFVFPNPQAGSELVFSIVQPLMRGGGYAYNRARLKVAQFDAGMGTAEYLRSLQEHLIEVNKAYWDVYLARAAFLQKQVLVAETKGFVEQLEQRQGVDAEATRSELLRSRSSLTQRQAALIRSEMAIRNAEERLRALVNDPGFAIGGGGEFIPLTRPVLTRPESDVKETALAALYHRAEVAEGFFQLQAAGLRRDMQRQDSKPQLNLTLESRMAGLAGSRQIGGAFNDQFAHGTGWNVGVGYEQSLERNLETARLKKREYELRQQVSQLRATIDQVLLDAVTTYRELMTAYREMQGRYQSVLASREEVKGLKERLDVDSNVEGQTMGYQLQLILDALDRNQQAEEQFLVSMVLYNAAFANVERAKGTLLEYYDIEVNRQRETAWKRHRKALESLSAGFAGSSPAVKADTADREAWERHRAALEKVKSERDR